MAKTRGSYARLAGEFGVIVVGVLTALGLEGGRQLWRDAETERAYLVALRDEVDLNASLISQYLNGTERVAAGLEGAITQIEGPYVEEARSDILLALMSAARQSGVVTGVSTAVFDDLRSTGNVRLIGDLELRRGMALTYARLESRMDRIDVYSERTDARLLHTLTGYGIRLRVRSAEDIDPTVLDRLAEDPALVPEAHREQARLEGILRTLELVVAGLERLSTNLDAAIAGEPLPN